ncbi:MAG: hypothetical protein ABI162_10790, partial [Luteolibacter sp.]
MSAALSVQNERAPFRLSRQPLQRALHEDKLKLELRTAETQPDAVDLKRSEDSLDLSDSRASEIRWPRSVDLRYLS